MSGESTFYCEKCNKEWEGFEFNKYCLDCSNKEELFNALLEIFKKESLEKWLDTPNREFNNLTPNQIIKNGDIKILWDMYYDITSLDKNI